MTKSIWSYYYDYLCYNVRYCIINDQVYGESLRCKFGLRHEEHPTLVLIKPYILDRRGYE